MWREEEKRGEEDAFKWGYRCGVDVPAWWLVILWRTETQQRRDAGTQGRRTRTETQTQEEHKNAGQIQRFIAYVCNFSLPLSHLLPPLLTSSPPTTVHSPYASRWYPASFSATHLIYCSGSFTYLYITSNLYLFSEVYIYKMFRSTLRVLRPASCLSPRVPLLPLLYRCSHTTSPLGIACLYILVLSFSFIICDLLLIILFSWEDIFSKR